MHGLTQSVTMDRRVRLLRLGALIAAALMLSLVILLHQRPSGGVGPDDRARARCLRITGRMEPRGRRAEQGRLPNGDADARP